MKEVYLYYNENSSFIASEIGSITDIRIFGSEEKLIEHISAELTQARENGYELSDDFDISGMNDKIRTDLAKYIKDCLQNSCDNIIITVFYNGSEDNDRYYDICARKETVH